MLITSSHLHCLVVSLVFSMGRKAKDGEPQVIVNLCVGFLISRAGGPLVIDQVWAGLAV